MDNETISLIKYLTKRFWSPSREFRREDGRRDRRTARGGSTGKGSSRFTGRPLILPSPVASAQKNESLARERLCVLPEGPAGVAGERSVWVSLLLPLPGYSERDRVRRRRRVWIRLKRETVTVLILFYSTVGVSSPPTQHPGFVVQIQHH